MRRLDRSKLEIIFFFVVVGLSNVQDSNRGHRTSETILRVRWGANLTHLSTMHGDYSPLLSGKMDLRERERKKRYLFLFIPTEKAVGIDLQLFLTHFYKPFHLDSQKC